jgi:hypothetical protein
VGIEDGGRQREVSEEEGRAVAHEIGALWCAEIALGRASTGEAVERLVTGLALAATVQHGDHFALLRHVHRANAGGEEGTTWHLPSAELCDELLARSRVMRENAPKQTKEEVNVRSCVLQ